MYHTTKTGRVEQLVSSSYILYTFTSKESKKIGEKHNLLPFSSSSSFSAAVVLNTRTSNKKKKIENLR